MTQHNHLFSQQDQRIRHRWLISLLILVGLHWLELGFTFIGLGSGLLSKDDVTAQAVAAIASVVTAAVLHHCAYKRHGTKLLTWSLFARFGGISRSLSSTTGYQSDWESDPWTVGWIAASIAVFVWQFILSVKLRGVNKRLRLRGTEQTAELTPQESSQ